MYEMVLRYERFALCNTLVCVDMLGFVNEQT